MITAIVLVNVDINRIPETAEAIADLQDVAEVYSCSGDIDLIVIVRLTEHQDLADVISAQLSKIPGVLRTDTHIGFRSYSRRDIEAAFSLGFNT